jgi:hypothetical protein
MWELGVELLIDDLFVVNVGGRWPVTGIDPHIFGS